MTRRDAATGGHDDRGTGTHRAVRGAGRRDRGTEAHPAVRGAGRGDKRTTTHRVAGGAGRRDLGQVAVEYLGFLPVLLLVGLAGIQLGIAAYAAQQAGTGARAAARAATHDEATLGPQQAGRAAMSDWIAERSVVTTSEGSGEFTATVRVRIPSVVPFWDGFGAVTRSATLPQPEEDEQP
ncbi:TadE family protein [Streptomyces sp. NPDC013457]|uniref:TadE family protein n=1 Tax=Streptomyces sp. NPDC013457 TaxID=3364866 RepID=UPI0036F4CBE1